MRVIICIIQIEIPTLVVMHALLSTRVPYNFVISRGEFTVIQIVDEYEEGDGGIEIDQCLFLFILERYVH